MEASSRQTEKNYFGAFLFICYVLAALVATSRISLSLWRQYQVLNESSRQTLEARLRVFAGLAFLSFSVLSYHMLHFLITRYSDWAQHRTDDDMEPDTDRKSFPNAMMMLAEDIWIWLSSSGLFQDFANTICSSASRYWWTSQALLMTMGWSVFMSVESEKLLPSVEVPIMLTACEGARRGTSRNLVYALISQILPVSFAMNLFFLSMFLHNEVPRPSKRSSSWTQISVEAAFVMSYFFLLSQAPAYVGKESFLTVVFLIRFWILLPVLIFLDAPSVSQTESKPFVSALTRGFFLSLSAGFLVFQTVRSRREQSGNILYIVTAINDDPSVSALGYDYLLGMMSILSWSYMKPATHPRKAS